MMKKRNKEFLYEKEYIRLKYLLDENRVAQRNLGKIKLDVPIHRGYHIGFKLRSDIANRADAWVYQKIIDLCSGCKFVKKKIKDLRNLNDQQRPELHPIIEKIYLSLPIEVQKHFAETTKTPFWWKNKYYYPTIPNFYFEYDIKKHYQTHIQLIDEVLLQEKAEIEKSIYSKFRRFHKEYSKAPKWYVKIYNRSYRYESKRITKYNSYCMIDNEDLWLEYSNPGRHSAGWSWW